MSRAHPKRPRDANQLAHRIVAESVGEAERTAAPERTPRIRAGGLKGGPARADKLTPEQRSEIARKGAAARWKPEQDAALMRRRRRDPDD